MKVLRFTHWPHFVTHAESLEGWAFRGQASPQGPLVSSLTRRLRAHCPDTRLWPLREARAMRIFRRKAHVHLPDPGALDDELRCLALMQHHGAATRLLDFTKSPFVAAFFALENAQGEACVYALDTPALWGRTPHFDPTLTRQRIDPRLPGHWARYFAANDRPLLWCGEPARMDARLAAQSGLFVVPGQLQMPLDEILQGYGGSDALLQQLLLAPGLRAQALPSLYRMNITHATLFPGLDGLARSLGYELEAVWERLVEDDEQGESARTQDDPRRT